eukprot:6126095-Pyramimonas_sp.AAC.1
MVGTVGTVGQWWGRWWWGHGTVEGRVVVGTVVRAVARTVVGQWDKGTVGTVVGTVGQLSGQRRG